MQDGGQRVQLLVTRWGLDIQHGEYSQRCYTGHLKVTARVNFKCSVYKKEKKCAYVR